jgi:4-amino-4-deoxy-L-arabinose transferase-like glycosyltransferase
MSTASPAVTRPQSSRFTRETTLNLERVKRGAPLGALALLTAVLYLWGLSRNGYANQYYAAAVQAGTHSWKAFLFGSLDAANYITVDKPPASLWLMELSSRLLGFSSFSMLLPQALEGVAAVALLYATVRRWFGRPAALLSGLILALTPVAALMFRFNNPDALLVLLLVIAAYGLVRALEGGGTRWMVVVGTALGFAFLTKMLQAFLVLPAFALAYLVAGPVGLRRRFTQLLLGGVALAVSAGWWVALVELWPASARPYVGGSTNDSILQLIFGWNGIDRLSGGQGAGSGTFSGAAGALRLFNSEMGGQISWLLPAALIVLIAGAVWTARPPRTDRTRAALLLWGGWLIVSAAVYSFMTGVIHPYYTNTLAPAIAALLGVGVTLLWRHHTRLTARLILAAMLAGTAAWSYVLLDRTPTWHPWLRFAVLAVAVPSVVATVGLGARLKRAGRAGLAAAALFVALAGPTAYTLSTVATAQSGSTAGAGPAVGSAAGFGGGGLAGRGTGAVRTTGPARSGPGGSGQSSVTRALTSLLNHDVSRYTWVAATSSSQTAASVELATGKSVMAIGGFGGSDPAITLAHFKQLVTTGRIHYYIAGGGIGGFSGRPGGGLPGGANHAGRSAGPGPGRSAVGGDTGGMGTSAGQATNTEIESWVKAHFKSTTVAGTTVYDLTPAQSS